MAHSTTFPYANSATIITAGTSATGTSWVSFPSARCNWLEVVNNTGASIDYRRNGAGSSITIPNGTSRLIIGISDASQISIRRTDTTNSQVTVTAEAFSL